MQIIFFFLNGPFAEYLTVFWVVQNGLRIKLLVKLLVKPGVSFIPRRNYCC